MYLRLRGDFFIMRLGKRILKYVVGEAVDYAQQTKGVDVRLRDEGLPKIPSPKKGRIKIAPRYRR